MISRFLFSVLVLLGAILFLSCGHGDAVQPTVAQTSPRLCDAGQVALIRANGRLDLASTSAWLRRRWPHQ